MRIYETLPDLTPAEATRLWMRPELVLDIAAMHGEQDARRFFHNVTGRESVLPFRRSGEGKTASKLYSLEGAVMARAMWEENGRGRSYQAAAVAARAVADLLPEALAFPTLADFRDAAPWRWILFDIPFGNAPPTALAIEAVEITPEMIEERDWWSVSIIKPHHLLARCIEAYADVWAAAIAKEEARAPAPAEMQT